MRRHNVALTMQQVRMYEVFMYRITTLSLRSQITYISLPLSQNPLRKYQQLAKLNRR